MREHVEAINQFFASFRDIPRSLDSKDNDATSLSFEIFLVHVVSLVPDKTRVSHPRNFFMSLQVFCHLKGILTVSFHAQAQGFHTLQQHPGVIWRHAPSQVSEIAGQSPEFESKRSQAFREIVSPAQSMVGCIWFVEERMFACSPVELASIDDDSSQTDAMSSDPFGGRICNNVSSMLQRLAQVGRRKSGVDNQWKTDGMSFIGNAFNIKDVQTGVGATFGEKGASLVVGCRCKARWIRTIDKSHFNSHLGKQIVKHGVGSAVQLTRSHDIISCRRQSQDGVENGIGSRGHREPSHFVSSFQLRIPRFKDMVGGIHETSEWNKARTSNKQ